MLNVKINVCSILFCSYSCR